jgi:uncharacterized membrane protein
MKEPQTGGGHFRCPPFFKAAAIEFAIVGGACLAVLFILIPGQITSGGEIGLSPGLIPRICAIAIGVLAFMQFVSAMLRGRDKASKNPVPIRHAALLMAAVALGLLVIRMSGLMAGCALIAVLVSAILGERRIARLGLIGGGVALAIFLIGQTGL